MTVVGSNTIAGDELRAFIERIENIRKQKKALQKDETAVIAQAKSKGYDAGGLRYVLKARDMKPHDRQEAETLRDVYMHAVGLGHEPPLFRALQAMTTDSASVEKVIEHMKALVPPNGEIIVKAGGKPMRIWRDREGAAQAEVYNPPVAGMMDQPKRNSIPDQPSEEVPDVDGDGAEELGRTAYRDNKPITSNPFPFGDARVARWDRGWRLESGSNGMGNGNNG